VFVEVLDAEDDPEVFVEVVDVPEVLVEVVDVPEVLVEVVDAVDDPEENTASVVVVFVLTRNSNAGSALLTPQVDPSAVASVPKKPSL